MPLHGEYYLTEFGLLWRLRSLGTVGSGGLGRSGGSLG